MLELSRRTAGNVLLSIALLLALTVALVSTAAAQTAGNLVTLASFAPPRLPEGLAVDRSGNLYTGLTSTGAVVRIAPDNTVTTLATLRGDTLGVALDENGDLLVGLLTGNAPNMDTHGVWRVKQDGTKQLVAALPTDGVPNVVLRGPAGVIYVSDSMLGLVHRIGRDGAVSTWLDHELIKPNTAEQKACQPNPHPARVGANGLAFDPQGALLVANTNKATIVRVPVNADGSAGTPSVWAGPDCANLLGADGISADGRGGLYVAANSINKVVHVAPGGTVRVLATAADGLDFPSSVEPGLGPRAGWLIVTNFAVFTAIGNPSQAKPAILALRLATAPTQLPTQLPRTGGLPIGLLLLSAAGLAVAGLAVRRGRR